MPYVAAGYNYMLLLVGPVQFSRTRTLHRRALLATHHSPETRHFIDADALSAMKRDVILINCARGGVVDTAALLAALDEGTIGGAGLDVTDPEPLPRDHALLQKTNLIIAPHRGRCDEGRQGCK